MSISCTSALFGRPAASPPPQARARAASEARGSRETRSRGRNARIDQSAGTERRRSPIALMAKSLFSIHVTMHLSVEYVRPKVFDLKSAGEELPHLRLRP
jgi:hypothetical protein